MRRVVPCLALSLGVVALVVAARPARAVPAEHPKECLARFAAALTSGNGAAARAECTDALWTRLAADVQGAERGTFVVLPQTVGTLTQELARGYVVWTQPDGVQDLFDVTLSGAGGTWKVSGGLGGGTPARPLVR